MKVHFKEVDKIIIKSELFVFLIIVCILCGVSAVSAGEIHNDTGSDIELNHEVLKKLKTGQSLISSSKHLTTKYIKIFSTEKYFTDENQCNIGVVFCFIYNIIPLL